MNAIVCLVAQWSESENLPICKIIRQPNYNFMCGVVAYFICS